MGDYIRARRKNSPNLPMAKSVRIHLTGAKAKFMEILHRRRRATVEELRAELPKAPSRSSVRKLLDIMIERGLLAREYDGPRFVYFPVAKPEEASRSAIRQLLQTFFNDSPSSAVRPCWTQPTNPVGR
jgi:predicted transcriptional regulator